MTNVDTVADRHTDRQKRIAAGVVRAGAREWATLDQDDLSGSWRRVGPRLAVILAAGQTAAAADGADYVDRAVRAQGVDPDPQGRVIPEALAGIAADGRPLDTLLLRTLITTKEGIGRGMPIGDALDLGGNVLAMYLATEVGDAGRSGEGIAMHASPKVHTYVRTMGGRGCARCAILAGGIYHIDTAFLRHPCCQCRNVPIAQGGDQAPHTVDAAAYFRGLSRAEQDRLFTIGGARAIRDGADLTSVVNARRGVYTAAGGRAATYDSTTRRGLYYQMERLRAQRAGTASGRYPRAFRLTGPRLLPEQIYAEAGSREEVLALLRQYGYLGWAP